MLTITASTAERAADLGSHLDVPVADADLLIAAQAAEEGAILVSSDRSLAALQTSLGIDIRDWTAV